MDEITVINDKNQTYSAPTEELKRVSLNIVHILVSQISLILV